MILETKYFKGFPIRVYSVSLEPDLVCIGFGLYSCGFAYYVNYDVTDLSKIKYFGDFLNDDDARTEFYSYVFECITQEESKRIHRYKFSYSFGSKYYADYIKALNRDDAVRFFNDIHLEGCKILKIVTIY